MKKSAFLSALIAVITLCGCGHSGTKTDSGKAEQAVKVKTETLKPQSASVERIYSGTIEAGKATALSFSVPGTISKLYVSEGQTVKSGEIIAEIDATSLRSAYNSAKATLAQMQDAYDRQKKLYENGSLPEVKWVAAQTQLTIAEQAESIAHKALENATLRAPYSGYISKCSSETGQNVLPGIQVAQIMNIDAVKVKITVPEAEIAEFEKNTLLKVRIPSLGEDTLSSIVSERGVSSDQLSRTYQIKGDIKNPGKRILPGMLCDVWKENGEAGSPAIMVPLSVISLNNDNSLRVWVVEDGKAAKRTVMVDGAVGDEAIIAGGLSEGDEVITEGWQKVSEGIRVADNE